VSGNVFAFSVEESILCPERFAVLTRLGDLPQSSVVIAQGPGALDRPYAIA
jgi:hypothetical protein